MKRQLLALSRRYKAALQKHLREKPALQMQRAHRLGQQAAALGMEMLDLVRIHTTALTALVIRVESPIIRNDRLQRAEVFFAEAIAPIRRILRAETESPAPGKGRNKSITQRTARFTAANRHLKQGLLQRKTAEAALRKSVKCYAKLLRESHQLQEQLRHLTHQQLSAQEAERKRMSNQLHDDIGQALLGINVRLLTLKKAARGPRANLAKEIASTQRVVKDSVQSINRFAHELDIHQCA